VGRGGADVDTPSGVASFRTVGSPDRRVPGWRRSITTWHSLFLLAAYTAALSCFIAAYRIGSTLGWAEGLKQLLIFLLFALLFYLLESWARLRVPYYFYPPVMPDMLATYPWSSYAWFPAPAPSPCIVPTPPDDGMSLTVPLMEAALTFSVMWTAHLLRAPVLLQPFLAGLVFLAVDAFLDPVLATSIDCMTGAPLQDGLGFWEWYIHEQLGMEWFGVPLFNYAAWYAAPLVLVSLVRIIGWVGLLAAWLMGSGTGTAPSPPSLLQLAFLLIILVGFLLIFALAPTLPWPIAAQGAILLLFVVGTLIATLVFIGQYKMDNPIRWEFVYPQLVAVGFPLLAFLFSGLMFSTPYLWLVALPSVALVVFYAVSPYIDS